MNIPERPQAVHELDLLKRLEDYATGRGGWRDTPPGSREQAACRALHTGVIAFVERCLQPLMNRVTAQEMRGFTMHDSSHGLKVAHLMWHILTPERRQLLTPAEIALMVVAAHFHDLGMGLSDQERSARLQPTSDLWDQIESTSPFLSVLSALTALAEDRQASESKKREALFQVQQAQEALLCMDSRDRHATRDRYAELFSELQILHSRDPIKVTDPNAALVFDGDSFRDKLIEICISHNEDAHVLLDPDPYNVEQDRFPREYPVGCCTADTRLVAAALRIADILDFDRERTPAILYHYLLPTSQDPFETFRSGSGLSILRYHTGRLPQTRSFFVGDLQTLSYITQLCISVAQYKMRYCELDQYFRTMNGISSFLFR